LILFLNFKTKKTNSNKIFFTIKCYDYEKDKLFAGCNNF
jgi:hypothetical protein